MKARPVHAPEKDLLVCHGLLEEVDEPNPSHAFARAGVEGVPSPGKAPSIFQFQIRVLIRPVGLGEETAVDPDCLPGYERRLFSCQKQDWTRNIFRSANAS